MVEHYTSTVDSGNDQREGMALLEYQAMPSLRNVAHDGWLCTFTYITAAVNSSSQPGGPQCWTSPLVFGLIGKN
jgi:hypothetical protein